MFDKVLEYDDTTGEYFSRPAMEFDGHDPNGRTDGYLGEITIDEGYRLENIQVNTVGYYAGYITGALLDDVNRKGYEFLYRIHDTANGNDYTLVSVDYGWKLNNDALINKIEAVLTQKAKELYVDFGELEKAQEAFNKEFDAEFNQGKLDVEETLFQKALSECIQEIENIPEPAPLNRFSIEYIVTIERTECRNIGGFDTSKDTVRFDSLECLSDFVKGKATYNHLDDSVRLRDYELPVKVEAGDGKVLFDSNYRINEAGQVVSKETIEKQGKEKEQNLTQKGQNERHAEEKTKKRDTESR